MLIYYLYILYILYLGHLFFVMWITELHWLVLGGLGRAGVGLDDPFQLRIFHDPMIQSCWLQGAVMQKSSALYLNVPGWCKFQVCSIWRQWTGISCQRSKTLVETHPQRKRSSEVSSEFPLPPESAASDMQNSWVFKCCWEQREL